MRTAVLAAGVLLVVSLVVYLAVGKWKNPFNPKELPQRLGVDIRQEANGFTYTQSHGGHTLFKIHASKVVQLKDNQAVLHDVKIELYGEDGSRVDRIEGDEFEYDKAAGTAKAAGPVEITLMRPGVAPAIAPKATPGKALSDKPKGSTLAVAAQAASAGEIHVKTSGLTFYQDTEIASTPNHVDFSMAQGPGSSTGATYDSKQGHLVLDRAVELNTMRGAEAVVLHAQHGDFERQTDICNLRMASADYRGGEATAVEAKVLFRPDGSAMRLDATGGFTLSTATGGHVAAPVGSMDFNEKSQPRHGHLEGGVTMVSVTRSGLRTRTVHGTAPTAEMEFTAQGDLRHTHLERGVEMRSEELTASSSASESDALRVSRTWKSPVADVEFRDTGHGQVEPASMHGATGVVITGESQRGRGPVSPFRLAADDMNGVFGPGSALTAITGVGHAGLEETTATGIKQTSSGDRLEVHFASGEAGIEQAGQGAAGQVESAQLDGHVILVQQSAAKTGIQARAEAPAPIRAWAGRAVYEGTGEWLHLTVNPRVEDGSLVVTAEKIDVSHESGDAFAHGNVKATWDNDSAGKTGTGGLGKDKAGQGTVGQNTVGLGGNGPAHVVSAEAQLHQATGEATFKGHARLWQQANSVSGPVIVLDRQRQTLVARSPDPAEPVRAVLLSVGGPGPGKPSQKGQAAKRATPSVISVRGGDLKYSDAEHKAVMHSGALGSVVAETATATSISNEVELTLLPPGNHAGKDGGPAQVDRMVARGRVTVTSGGRRGTGEQLVYSGESGEYVLTGTAATPPSMTDPARGNVTGEALIFHSRDDSVSVEGGVTKTVTTAPK